MNIGILTWVKVDNYGAALQAYAMKRVLENLGHGVIFLDYDRFLDIPKISWLERLLAVPAKITPFHFIRKIEEKKKVKAYSTFRSKYLPLGVKYDIDQKLDVVIIGSDEIFDLSVGYNSFCYGKDVLARRVISYAPSFGPTTFSLIKEKNITTEVARLLSKMSNISVRDENSCDIVTALTGKDVPVVVDPVLLYGFQDEKSQWNHLDIPDEPYVAIYTYGGNSETDDFKGAVLSFARSHGLKVVYIGLCKPWADTYYASATPEEFFQIINHASYIITNTFHGTAFSILLKKQFCSMVWNYNYNKLGFLLKSLGFENRRVDDIEQLDKILSVPIDYSNALILCESRRAASLDYLRAALADDALFG